MSGTLDPLIPDQVRYHCPIMILLRFTPPRANTLKRKVWYYKLADYDKYREDLSEATLLQRSKLIAKSTRLNRTFRNQY